MKTAQDPRRRALPADVPEAEKLVPQRDQPKRARLVRGKFGRPVLVAQPGAPPMTPERVEAILDASART